MSVCRLCLSGEPEDVDIFKGITEGKRNYSEQLEEMFQIKLISDEPWPSTACGSCITLLERMQEFKRTIISTQDTLSKLYAEVKCELVNEGEIKVEDASQEDGGSPPSATVESVEETGSIHSDEESEFNLTKLYAILPEDRIEFDKMLRDLNVLKCSECDIPFETFEELNSHFKLMHMDGPRYRKVKIRCCDLSFQGSTQVYDHMRFHRDPNAFTCSICGSTTHCRTNLKMHMLLHKRKFVCEVCGRAFPSQAKLTAHAVQHKPDYQPFPCLQCDRKFKSKAFLKTHVNRAHEPDYSIVCAVCGKVLPTKSHLAPHMRTHDAKKSTECDICGKQYLKMSAHKRRKHSTSSNVPCEICKKEFDSRYMPKHMKLAHAKKKFKCTICPKKFRTESQMKIHLDIHLGVKYQCLFCPHEATSKANRASHQALKHPEELAEYREKRGKEVKLKLSFEEKMALKSSDPLAPN